MDGSHIKLKLENSTKRQVCIPMSESPPPDEFSFRNISCFLDFTIGEVFSSLVKNEGR